MRMRGIRRHRIGHRTRYTLGRLNDPRGLHTDFLFTKACPHVILVEVQQCIEGRVVVSRQAVSRSLKHTQV